MKALIICEESQTVCKALRKRGHEAYSNDIIKCSGGHPEWHIQGHCFEAMFKQRFDFLGAHPPCTYLANSGVRWLYNPDGTRNEDRWEKMETAATFFKTILNTVKSIGKGYVENPIMHKYALEIIGERPTQIIQPWQFGHPETKATCLWVVGLPPLKPTNIVEGREQRIWKLPPSPDRAKLRSKTYEGIGEAISNQWT